MSTTLKETETWSLWDWNNFG